MTRLEKINNKYSEGIAFALTAKDNIGSGLAILIAMIVRVIPMKLGYAQILSKSGLRQGFKCRCSKHEYPNRRQRACLFKTSDRLFETPC